MIDRINNVTPRPYGDVSKLNNQRGGSGSAGSVGDNAFQDTYGGVIYEPSGQKLISQTGASDRLQSSFEEEGVKLDLSSAQQVSSSVQKDTIVNESFMAMARRIWHSAIGSVKDFFRNIWEGNSVVSEPEQVAAEGTRAGLSINQSSSERLAQLLKQDNRGKLAKNSDLLTYYDRSGHILKMDPTEKNKILRGTDRTIKL